MVERRALLLGSLPGETAEEAMQGALDILAPYLDYLPDGETGERRHWIASTIDRLAAHPGLRVRRAGQWSDYKDQVKLSVRRGHRLRGAGLDLGYVTSYEDSRPEFDRLRTKYNRDDLAFQVGIPGPFDMTLFTLGLRGLPRHRRAFTDATVRQIERISDLGGDEVLFQIEVPAELVFVTKVPAVTQPAMAAWMGRMIAELGHRAPIGTRFGIHLCLGDLGHKALGSMHDARPLVHVANSIARHWPADRRLEYLHAPLAAGEDPPVLTPSFYRPLGGLRLPETTRFVAGVLHERRTVAELRPIIELIDSHLGYPVDVAASCGLGRRSHDDARAVMNQAAELCAGGLVDAAGNGDKGES